MRNRLSLHKSKNSGFYIGIASAILGLVILYMAGSESQIPSKDSLAGASGVLESFHKAKSSITFRLKGDSRNFRHLSRNGEFLAVHEALSGTSAPTVAVLFDPSPGWQPMFSENAYQTVYEVRVSGKTVLSYEQAEDSWKTNRQIGKGLGAAFLFIGIGLAGFARLRNR